MSMDDPAEPPTSPETIGVDPLRAFSRKDAIGDKASCLNLEAVRDCLLLASAPEPGCTHVLSEDLQDERAMDGLTTVDPFAHSPGQISNS
jgi:hypothetical protein